MQAYSPLDHRRIAMLLVKTYVAPSRIHGLGLFAAERIPRGARIWEFNPVMDRFVSREEFESLPPAARESLRVYAYPWPKGGRSEEHPSELQSIMRNSYAVFCLKK